MTRAAAYARFSSDSQRDESIEIQLEAISRFCESRGWELLDPYTDYAISGRREDRPAFNRCVADALQGRFEVLVVSKIDRFARNVIFAQETKMKLFAAGVRLFSVREGEVDNTPEGFLKGGINDLFAEYYSRNLSVNVKGGIKKSAQQRKAAGRRIFGYGVDAEDRFVVNPAQADVVRGMFEAYAAGRSMCEIRDDLNARGVRNIRGNRWNVNTIGNVLANQAYRGLYEYDGEREEGAIPRIVDDALFEAVRDLRARRKNGKRRKVVNDYLLTDKVWCLRCGKPMCGTAGTSRNGTKYTYYGCMNKGGCQLRVPSKSVEDTVSAVVAGMLMDPDTIDAIAQDMVDYGRTVETHADEYRSERSDVARRRDNLVKALGDGAPYQSLSEALTGCEERISELDRLIAEEDEEMAQYRDKDAAKAFLMRMMSAAADSDEYARLLIGTFIDRIYCDRERVVLTFNLTAEPDGEPFKYTIEEIQAVADGKADARPVRTWPILPSTPAQKESEPAGRQQVRMIEEWSG